MAVKLRLRRMGKKRQPIYKVVAVDSRAPRDGKFIEAVGIYNPKTNPHHLEIDEERAMYWLGVGAQPTHTVKSLLRQKGITLKSELIKRGLPDELIEAEMKKWRESKKSVEEVKEVKKSEKQESTAEVKDAASEENAPEEVKAEAPAEQPKAEAEAIAEEAKEEEASAKE